MSNPSRRERSRGCSSQFLLSLEHEDLAKERNLYINIEAYEYCRIVDQSSVHEKKVQIFISVYIDEILDIIMRYLKEGLLAWPMSYFQLHLL